MCIICKFFLLHLYYCVIKVNKPAQSRTLTASTFTNILFSPFSSLGFCSSILNLLSAPNTLDITHVFLSLGESMPKPCQLFSGWLTAKDWLTLSVASSLPTLRTRFHATLAEYLSFTTVIVQ